MWLVYYKFKLKLFKLMEASHKLLALVEFLKAESSNPKILLFCCSAASVEYLTLILPQLVNKKLKLLALHRKKCKRDKIVSILSSP